MISSNCIFEMSEEEVADSVPLNGGKGGSKARYPWYTYKVGKSFFKPMSKEDMESGKGRPAPPKGTKEQGIVWTTQGIWNATRKQYGYQCTRIA